MSDIEQPLLQAARDMQQPAPAPALDAAILDAAAQRAAEVRKARTVASEAPAAIPKAPKKRSASDRFSRWLFGDGETRGHLWQTVAVGAFMGIAFGFLLHVNRETASTFPEIAMMEPLPAPSAIVQREAPEEERAGRAMRFAEEKPAEASARLEAIATEARTDSDQRAAASPVSPPAETYVQARSREAPSLLVTAPVASPSPRQMERGAEERAADRYEDTVVATLARRAAPSSAQDAVRAKETDAETEIDAQLKRVLDLRHAGKEEDAQLLLRQLRARYPDIDIDKRLHEMESELEKARGKEKSKEKNKEGKK